MKQASLCLILSAICILLGAAPLSNVPIELIQPDSSRLSLFASGDEYYNWVHDEHDFRILRDSEGWYVYAIREGEDIAPGRLRVEETPPLGLEPGIQHSDARIDKIRRQKHEQLHRHTASKAPGTGLINNLVIFIKFADDSEFEITFNSIEELFNASGAEISSLKQYYWDTSYEQLLIHSSFFPAPQGQNILAYTDIYPRSYFQPYSPSNPNGYEEDNIARCQQVILRALSSLANQIPPDLDLDMDDDGFIDNICLIVRGSSGGWAEFLWPHYSAVYTEELQINGALPGGYNLQMEASMLSEDHGVCVLAHEMFHSIGAPDLYRYTNTNINPVGGWDLMSHSANPPCQPGAWMKYKYGGWASPPTLIFQSGSYSLSPLASGAANLSYRINSWTPGEYYVLEYRKACGQIDATIPGTGLLVYRINTTMQGNSYGPPDEVYIYRPGGNNNSMNGNVNSAAMSAQTGFTTLCEASKPSGFNSSNQPGGLNLYDVGEANGSISFKVKISNIQLTAPTGGETWISGDSKSIKWVSRYNTGSVKLEFSQDLGQTWALITDSTINNGSYLWENIPEVDSEHCLVKIHLLDSYHTDTSSYPFTIASNLQMPELVYPPDLAEAIPTNPMLSWNPVAGAQSYHLQIARDPDFEELCLDQEQVLGNTYQASLLEPFTQHFWRLASHAGSNHSGFCPARSFTTGQITETPGSPSLIYPAPYATGTSLTPLLSWKSVPLADSYRVQVARDCYYVNIVFEESILGKTSCRTTPLQALTMHYWRVCAQNISGSSAYSGSRLFTTGDGVFTEDDNQVPSIDSICKINPNPFRENALINLEFKDLRAHARLEIYNLRGQLVRSLHQGYPVAHKMELLWDAKDENGERVAPGIYLGRLSTKDGISTRKMVLIR
ncbi:MAG: M6 family metalloprotease domain-containing protein [Candidatus Cloacimonadaceae bacterium]|jgi:M6 family metalloprotease-like protein|nr:M6 family metalloprotease domain-containing protein [Candidatus Cloacimonadaceae bacterium]